MRKLGEYQMEWFQGWTNSPCNTSEAEFGQIFLPEWRRGGPTSESNGDNSRAVNLGAVTTAVLNHAGHAQVMIFLAEARAGHKIRPSGISVDYSILLGLPHSARTKAIYITAELAKSSHLSLLVQWYSTTGILLSSVTNHDLRLQIANPGHTVLCLLFQPSVMQPFSIIDYVPVRRWGGARAHDYGGSDRITKRPVRKAPGNGNVRLKESVLRLLAWIPNHGKAKKI
ncbi:uncharacterized protein EI90DRAFT_3287336 [Cantharellus anzutake]|uniref:uncharacterized protein n=1 Tax=Cantharellus anzutake TaxID=1750568 RepID=UPI0019043813|nr:uncharacterized protein EI90DRAFT_3287336 [Cantharellus anzutake]KAF8337028.1 hypothetical protein EI90DRAFT_3287336 [Cantharellus anzutake]